MKFYGVALVGILATAVGLANAAYADTVIASKQYVDSKFANVDVSAAVENGTGSNTALQLTSSTTAAPSVRAVLATKDNTEVVTRNTTANSDDYNGITVTAGSNTDDNHFLTSLTHKNDMDVVKAAINAMDFTIANANHVEGRPIVQVTQLNGIVTATEGTITYDAGLSSALGSINASGGASEASYAASCTAANPCVLSFFDGHYQWTNMNTEGLDGVY